MAPASKRPLTLSSSGDTIDGICSIEKFVASKDPFVVNPHNNLPILPPYQVDHCDDFTQSVFAQIRPQIETILRKLNIKGTPQVRTLVTEDMERRQQMFIETRDENPEYWFDAASQIQELFGKNGLSFHHINIKIFNAALSYSDRSTVLDPIKDIDIRACIRDVEGAVVAAAKELLSPALTSIRWHMRGRLQGPWRPTLILTVKPGSLCAFNRAQDEIMKALDSKNFPNVTLNLEIFPGSVVLANPYTEPPWARVYMDLPRKPTNGSSIGVFGRQALAGTLGGFVDVNFADGRVKHCILTCYHCVAPGDSISEKRNGIEGIGLNENAPLSTISISYPSELDSRGSMAQMAKYQQSKTLDPIFREKVQETVNLLENFFGPQGAHIGNVLAASGNIKMSATKSRCDWALIECHNNTFAQNKPPVITSAKDLRNHSIPYYVAPGDTIKHICTHDNGEWVAFTGSRTTGVGVISPEPLRAIWEDCPESLEVEILPDLRGDDFCIPGDLGSWVVNQRKELIGMLIGKDIITGHLSSGIMTPMYLIQQDIRERLGAEISLP